MPEFTENARLVFVGTGGGGSMVATQTLVTAGTYIEIGQAKFYIDPGPGAVLRSRQLGLKLEDLDALFLTHSHLDHVHDFSPLVEAATNLDDQKVTTKLTIFTPQDYLSENPIKEFLKKKIKKTIIVQPEATYHLNQVTIISTKKLIEKPKYKNNLPEVYGYWFKSGKIDLGFWSQSQYQKNITHGFKPKILIMDFWLDEGEPWQDQINIIKEIKPQLIILRHFILSLAKANRLDKIKQRMQQETGIKVKIAKEGEIYVVN